MKKKKKKISLHFPETNNDKNMKEKHGLLKLSNITTYKKYNSPSKFHMNKIVKLLLVPFSNTMSYVRVIWIMQGEGAKDAQMHSNYDW